jgi:FixJ family two-component response regulator
MKAGAIDVLPMKPINPSELFEAIKRAKERDSANAESRAIRALLQNVTRRERDVLNHLVVGRLNKQTAFILGISEKTITLHRGRVMQKLGLRHVAQLVRRATGYFCSLAIEVGFWHLADFQFASINVRFWLSV